MSKDLFENIRNKLVGFSSEKTQLIAAMEVRKIKVMSTQDISTVMADKIANAQSTVTLSGYKFHGNSIAGKKIISALEKLRQNASETNPINVTFLINKRGNLAEYFYKPNYQLGLDSLIKDQDQYPYFKLSIQYYVAQAFDSYHAKQVIIDENIDNQGTVIFSGGDIQTDNDNLHQQYETAVLVESDQMAKIAKKDFNLALNISQFNNPEIAPALQSEFNKTDKEMYSTSITQVNSSSSNGIYLSSTAQKNPLYTPGQAPYKKALLESIKNAQKSIHILTANLNDKDIIQALFAAANRGVNVSIVMSKYKNDQGERFLGGTNYFNAKLLDSLVLNENKKNLRIHWTMNPETGKLVQNGGAYTMHGKFCLIDRENLLMGSSPLDLQSMRCSREVDVMLKVSNEEGTEILNTLFDTPFKLSRDYYVDEIIDILTSEVYRLQKESSELSKQKAEILNGLVDQLSKPCFTPNQAFECISIAKENMVLSRKKINMTLESLIPKFNLINVINY